MKRVCVVLLLMVCLAGCKQREDKTKPPSAEKTAVDALPENIGDKNVPTAIKALRGAEEVKKRKDAQREKESEVLKEAN